MNTTNAYLILNSKTKVRNLDILEGLKIISAASNSLIFVCENEQDLGLYLPLIKKNFFGSVSGQIEKTGDFRFLQNVSTNKEILFVVIGELLPLKVYITERFINEKAQINWHVISSSFARFGFLDRRVELEKTIPADTYIFIKDLIRKYGKKKILDCLFQAANSQMEAVLIGDTIIDEYIYCDPLGRSTKEPLVAFKENWRDQQLGGVLAVAKNLFALGAKVHLLSSWGNDFNNLIETNLPKNFSNFFHSKIDAPLTIQKKRFVDKGSNNRVFESYIISEEKEYLIKPNVIEQYQRNNAKIENLIIMDYGHGVIDHSKTADYLKFFSNTTINTQSNAGNRGFNPISNYFGADRVFLNESEVKMEMRKATGSIQEMIDSLAKKIGCGELYVTNGSNGIISFEKKDGITLVPAFAPRIVDRTGAGDAALSVISLLRTTGIPVDISCFYGNIAGSLMVNTMGNEINLDLGNLNVQADRIIQSVVNTTK